MAGVAGLVLAATNLAGSPLPALTGAAAAIGDIAGFVSPYMVALIKGDGPGLGHSAAAVLVTAVFLALAAVTMAAVGRRIGRRRVAAPAAVEVAEI